LLPKLRKSFNNTPVAELNPLDNFAEESVKYNSTASVTRDQQSSEISESPLKTPRAKNLKRER
jgi:hypothetical protein